MKKQRIFVLTACVMMMSMSCGCMSVAPNADAPESVHPDTPVTGSWHSPGGSTIDFNEDGTYVDHTKKNRTGTYTYVAENTNFSLAQLFDHVEYVTCTDENGEEAITCAVMQDVMIAYSENDHKELYYLRDGRQAVDAKTIQGKWMDVYDEQSTLEFTADGTLSAFNETSAYTIQQGDSGTYITVKSGSNETSYVIASYEDYLFMISNDTQMYLLTRETASE